MMLKLASALQTLARSGNCCKACSQCRRRLMAVRSVGIPREEKRGLLLFQRVSCVGRGACPRVPKVGRAATKEPPVTFP